jgi:DNA-binding IclR family transcriptional regulator
VQVLDRAIAILNCFSEEKPQMGVAELARGAGINKATVHRLLGELQQHGWIQQNAEDRRYRLGFKLLELGNRVVDRLDLASVARPFLNALANDTGETAHLAILDDGMCYYVAKVESRYSIRMRSHVGKRNPAHCTGVGKVLLAFATRPEADQIVADQGLPKLTRRTITQTRRLFEELSRIRERGYAIDDQEFEEGLRCVATPVRDHTNTVVAALSVSGPTTRMTNETLPKIVGKVVRLANEISVALGLPRERTRDGPGNSHSQRS